MQRIRLFEFKSNTSPPSAIRQFEAWWQWKGKIKGHPDVEMKHDAQIDSTTSLKDLDPKMAQTYRGIQRLRTAYFWLKENYERLA